MKGRRVYRGAGTKTFAQLGGFRNLLAWQRADDLADVVHRITGRLGPGYYRLSDQMRGAAISVTGNIAEGYARGALGDYIRFCEIARASLAELGTYIQDCERWGLVTGDELGDLVSLYGETSYLLNQLLRGLYKKRRDGTWQRPIREPPADYVVQPSLPSSPDEEVSP
jgi:four helix bundle protein